MDKSLVNLSSPVALERLKRPSEFPPENRKRSVGDVPWNQQRQMPEVYVQDRREVEMLI